MKTSTIIACLAVVLFNSCTEKAEEKKARVLPLVGNYDIEYRTVNGKEIADTVYPKVPAFAYLNQDSVMVDSKSMKGKVWIADFFFTSCPTICPPMTSQMKRLNILTKDLEEHLQFMSFTIDPDTDTPQTFRDYIKSHGIAAKNWQFFTGDEDETYELALDFFFVGAERNEDAAGGFEHNDTFVLIDKEGYVRGLYKGSETKDVDRLEKDIRKLLKHEYNVNIAEKN